MFPVEVEDSLRPQSDTISYQDLHETITVQVIVGFYDDQEDLIEGLLPQHCKMLQQLGFKGGCNRAPALT